MARDHYVRGGDAGAGYEIWLELDKDLMHIHIWGSWVEPLAHVYAVDCKRLTEVFGRPYVALVDAKGAPIQIPVVKAIRGDVIAKAMSETGLYRIAYLTSEVLPMWQAQRMAQASGCKETECFEDESEALVWLRRGGPVAKK